LCSYFTTVKRGANSSTRERNAFLNVSVQFRFSTSQLEASEEIRQRLCAVALNRAVHWQVSRLVSGGKDEDNGT